MEEIKNPSDYAEKQVNKKLGDAIAERKYKIKQLQADIKRIEKEIEKIVNGELVPETSDSSHSGKIISESSKTSGYYTTPFLKYRS